MATVFADRSYRASRKKRAGWSFQSVPLFIVGLLLVILCAGSVCVDLLPAMDINIIPVSSSAFWGSSGVWIFMAICAAFLASICIDMSKPRKVK